ncbi:MAG: TetR/AcrR family transcriptional regulator [Spirochaetales bacterium]|nr:TetR/AcrR family transcriptional regulator [Spirochaetales bacterium]
MEVRILEGASTLFYRFGFNRVRFSEIAREVGITTRTIYNYFPNKISLSKAVSEYTIRQVMTRLKDLLLEDLSYAEMTVRMLGEIHRELSVRLPAYQKDAGHTGPPDLLSVDPEIADFVKSMFIRAVEEGLYDRSVPEEIMMQVMLAQVNFCFPSEGGEKRVSEEYFIDSMLFIIRSCLTERGRREFAPWLQPERELEKALS